MTKENSIKTLIANKSSIDATDTFGCTDLFNAAELGTFEEVDVLIQKGANVNQTSLHGMTSLHAAALSTIDGGEKIKILIKAGVDINAKNSNGVSPLHMSCINGIEDSTNALLDNKADTTITNNGGCRPEDVISNASKSSEIKETVSKHRADLEKKRLLEVDKDSHLQKKGKGRL